MAKAKSSQENAGILVRLNLLLCLYVAVVFYHVCISSSDQKNYQTVKPKLCVCCFICIIVVLIRLLSQNFCDLK